MKMHIFAVETPGFGMYNYNDKNELPSEDNEKQEYNEARVSSA